MINHSLHKVTYLGAIKHSNEVNKKKKLKDNDKTNREITYQ